MVDCMEEFMEEVENANSGVELMAIFARASNPMLQPRGSQKHIKKSEEGK